MTSKLTCYGVYLDRTSEQAAKACAKRLGLSPRQGRSEVIRRALAHYVAHLETAEVIQGEAPGERLKRLREASGFRRPKDLALALGVSRSMIEHAESGKNPIAPGGPLDTFCRWAELPCYCPELCVRHPLLELTLKLKPPAEPGEETGT